MDYRGIPIELHLRTHVCRAVCGTGVDAVGERNRRLNCELERSGGSRSGGVCPIDSRQEVRLVLSSRGSIGILATVS